MGPIFPVLGSFNVGRATAAGATAFVQGVPPFMGQASIQFVSSPSNLRGITHITRLLYTTGATAHQIGVMRPFNWTTTSAAAAVNQAVINLTANPGTYSAGLAYPNALGSGTSALSGAVADNGIAAGDYLAFQLTDGTWWFDKVSSVATLAITMTTSLPNVTGGGVASGARVYFFGVIGDKDPNTGVVNPQTTTVASTNRIDQIQDQTGCGIAALHVGDPLLFYSPNTTDAGVLDGIMGFYADR
jgi:hypothetical protein